MKTPITVHALYHHNNVDGAKIYSELYSLLCRNVNDPFSDGLDIPVYFTTGDNNYISSITKTSSVKNVFLIFIDINMFCSERWRNLINELIKSADENIEIVGVKQYKNAFSINKSLGEIQSIVVDESSKENISLFDNDNWERFTTQLLDLLIRTVSGKMSNALKVFISHSKHDTDGRGVNAAKEIRNFLASDTKLNSFFDVHDILDGYHFETQIKEHVKNSAFLILFTDTYSSREWCKIEALTAKQEQVPILAVSMLRNHIDRAFPYIGNIPFTVCEGDWRKVINILMRTVLDQKVQKSLLESISDEGTMCISYPPEAFNLSLLDDNTRRILYPEPPLGNEELDVLKKISKRMNRNIIFSTPMDHLTENINLHEKYVGISISESHELSAIGIGEEMFKDLQIELTRHILKANGKLMYGGDLRKGGFTEIFKEMAKQYGQKEKAEAEVFYIENYLSWPLYNNLSIEQKADYLASRVQLVNATPGSAVAADEINLFMIPDTNENKLKWATSLVSMRNEIIKNSAARVIVGGRLHGFAGFMAGVVEEFKIAISQHQPIFIVGGFGGASHLICNIIEGKSGYDTLKDKAFVNYEYRNFFNWCEENENHIDYESFDGLKIEDLHNNLSYEENITLFHSVDIIEIVSLILKGLNQIKNEA